MLFRNLIYTGLTKANKPAVFVGTRKALAMAVKNQHTSQRQTALKELIVSEMIKKAKAVMDWVKSWGKGWMLI